MSNVLPGGPKAANTKTTVCEDMRLPLHGLISLRYEWKTRINSKTSLMKVRGTPRILFRETAAYSIPSSQTAIKTRENLAAERHNNRDEKIWTRFTVPRGNRLLPTQ